MNNLYSWMIISFASILASFLVFIGIKKLPLKSKGIFGLMLTFFILSGCNDKLDSKQKDKEEIQKKDIVMPLNSINIEKEFKSNERWLKIKKVWQKLDKVEPKENGSYMNTLKGEAHVKLNKEMLDAFGYSFYKLIDIKKTRGVSNLEELVYTLIMDRINELTFPPISTTRMMVPPSLGFRQTSILDMEKQIDVLLKLKKENKVDSKDIEKVLIKIQEKVYMSCILNVFKSSRVNYRLNLKTPLVPQETSKLVDEWIEQYNKTYTKAIKSFETKKKYIEALKKSHIKVQKDLESIKKLKPKIYDLIKALESK